MTDIHISGGIQIKYVQAQDDKSAISKVGSALSGAMAGVAAGMERKYPNSRYGIVKGFHTKGGVNVHIFGIGLFENLPSMIPMARLKIDMTVLVGFTGRDWNNGFVIGTTKNRVTGSNIENLFGKGWRYYGKDQRQSRYEDLAEEMTDLEQPTKLGEVTLGGQPRIWNERIHILHNDWTDTKLWELKAFEPEETLIIFDTKELAVIPDLGFANVPQHVSIEDDGTMFITWGSYEGQYFYPGGEHGGKPCPEEEEEPPPEEGGDG